MVVLPFGPFFHKIIWSPRSRVTGFQSFAVHPVFAIHRLLFYSSAKKLTSMDKLSDQLVGDWYRCNLTGVSQNLIIQVFLSWK
jgi:hypothetical protein